MFNITGASWLATLPESPDTRLPLHYFQAITQRSIQQGFPLAPSTQEAASHKIIMEYGCKSFNMVVYITVK